MTVSMQRKKIVIYDTTGPHSQQNLCFDPKIAKEKWYNYSASYLYEECQKKGIQLITPDIYFALSKRPKAICVRERFDIDMRVSLALQRSGVRLAVIRNSENPLYGCRFYWNLPKLTSHFDHSIVVRGVKDWVSPRSTFHPQYTPHAYYHRIREVKGDFDRKHLVLIQRNASVHWMKRLYVSAMNLVRPLPNFENKEGYVGRFEAIRYFSEYPDFDLYGFGWEKPVRYTRKYDEAIRKSWRGAPDDKFEVLKQYKFSLVLENSYLGGYVQYLTDSIYAGSVPVYWGAPDISEIFPPGCFIDFRKFRCDFKLLDEYLRNMKEDEYKQYIFEINKFINSPTGGYMFSQERYVSELIKLFEAYF